jgi:hypothetical protein
MHNMSILKCISSLINRIISTALTVTYAGSLHGKYYINTYTYLWRWLIKIFTQVDNKRGINEDERIKNQEEK